MYRLIALNGKLRGQRVVVRAPAVTAGRDPGCELRLEGEGVASRHARLQEHDGVVTVSALEAGARVTVNGVVEIARRLEAGDRLGLGEFEFEFQPGADAGATAVPAGREALRRPAPVVLWTLIALFLLAQIAAMVALNRLYRDTAAAFAVESASDSTIPRR